MKGVFFFFPPFCLIFTHFPSDSFFRFSIFPLHLSRLYLSTPLHSPSSFLPKCLPFLNLLLLVFINPSLFKSFGNQLWNKVSNQMLPSCSSSTWIAEQLELVQPFRAGVQNMEPALCSARSPTNPSPTISAVNSFPFARQSPSRRGSPGRNEAPFPQRKIVNCICGCVLLRCVRVRESSNEGRCARKAP